jgi:hypothetical protein
MREGKLNSTGGTPVPPALLPYARLQVIGDPTAGNFNSKINYYLP